MAKNKRIRDFKRTPRDFPVYRQLIENNGWVPNLLCDDSGTYWDGFSAVDKDGKEISGLSDSARKQMINMVLDGYFGDEVKEAFVDQTHYWQIRDQLITWPNQEAIKNRGLRVQPVTRRAERNETASSG